MARHPAFRLAWPAVLACFVAAGCDTTMTVQRYPAFYDPSLKSLAVLPFTNATLHARAGEFLAGRLAAALQANGTYEVTGPEELKAKLAAAKIALPPKAAAGAMLAAVRKLGGIQAVLIGTVTGFSADRGSTVEIDDWYGPGFGWGYWRHGHHYYGSYATARQYYYTHAYVSAGASMVRVADGRTIHATVSPLAARVRSRGDVDRTRSEVLSEAADAVVRALVGEFAVAPTRLKISRGKTLRTARPQEGGTLELTDDFRADEDTMCVLVRLPAEADRNPFRLTITEKKHHKVLAEETFTWSAKDETRQFTFSPRKLAEAAGGEKFRVTLHLRDEPVVDRGFKIED